MKEEKPANFKTTVFELLELIVLCTITVVLIVTFCARLTFVQQHSMDKTLTENDLLLVSNLFYKPQRGDIVVSQNSSLSAHPDPLIKRVIAVGGDELTINFKTWQITINSGSETFTLDESSYRYLAPTTPLTSDWYDRKEENGAFTYVVPEGYVFLMGDNRNVSADSRSKSIGLMPESCVIGKAVARLYPFASFTFFQNPFAED